MDRMQSCSYTGPTVHSGCRGFYHLLGVSASPVEYLFSPPGTWPHIPVMAVEDTPGGRGYWKAGFLVQEEVTVPFLVFKFGLCLNQTETDSSEISCN